MPEALAADYVNAEKGVETVEDALSGASDIVAELISDDAGDPQKAARLYRESSAYLVSKSATEDDDSVYRLYYDFKQRVDRLRGIRSSPSTAARRRLPSRPG